MGSLCVATPLLNGTPLSPALLLTYFPIVPNSKGHAALLSPPNRSSCSTHLFFSFVPVHDTSHWLALFALLSLLLLPNLSDQTNSVTDHSLSLSLLLSVLRPKTFVDLLSLLSMALHGTFLSAWSLLLLSCGGLYTFLLVVPRLYQRANCPLKGHFTFPQEGPLGR